MDELTEPTPLTLSFGHPSESPITVPAMDGLAEEESLTSSSTHLPDSQTTRPTMQVTTFPNEIWAQIFGYLDRQPMRNLRLANNTYANFLVPFMFHSIDTEIFTYSNLQRSFARRQQKL